MISTHIAIGDIVRLTKGSHKGKVGIVESFMRPRVVVTFLVPAYTVKIAGGSIGITFTTCEIDEIIRLVPEFPEATK